MKKLLQMLSAVGMLVCSGQFDAYCSAINNTDLEDKSCKQLVIAVDEDSHSAHISQFPVEVMMTIFDQTSKVINPRHLTSVCKSWRNIFGLNDYDKVELHYSDMSSYMQKCVNTYWESQFNNGVLRDTPTSGEQRFSDLLDGTFNLLAFGDIAKHLVITTSVKRFFQIEEENKDKTVILITLRHLVEKGIKSQDHSFDPLIPLMAAWDCPAPNS